MTYLILTHFNTPAPEPADIQYVSFLSDLRNRPSEYRRNLVTCPPVLFSTGSMLYSVYLGTVGGVRVGGAGAFVFQGLITAITAGSQARAIYRGKEFSSPYRKQAYANWATAATICTAGIASGHWPMAVLPTIAYGLWGFSERELAKIEDRKSVLRDAGSSKDEIDADPQIQKMLKTFSILTGVGDAIAPFKNLPVTAFLHPDWASLWTSLLPLPVILFGLASTFCKRLRFTDPSNVYGAGYGVSSLVAISKAIVHRNYEWVFGAATGFWAVGYRKLATLAARPQPLSAVAYARMRQASAHLLDFPSVA